VNRHRPTAFALLAAASLALATTSTAAPKERYEAVTKDDTPTPAATDATTDGTPAPPVSREPSAAGGAASSVPDDFVQLPMIEGAGGPHVGHHSPQHGGALVPIGESTAHLEFVLDPEDGMLTMYVLDGEARDPKYLPQELVFVKLAANGKEFPIVLFQQDDSGMAQRPAQSARYAASHQDLTGVERFEALIEGMTFGQQSYHRIPFPYPEGTE